MSNMKENNFFELVHIHELPSVFNREIPINAEMLKGCSLAYLVVFQYKEGSESVGLHVSIRYMTPDNKVLMQEGATLVAVLDGWKEMSREEKELRADIRFRSLVDYGLAFVSGMVFRRTSGTVMNSIFVPHMAVGNIINEVRIEEVK